MLRFALMALAATFLAVSASVLTPGAHAQEDPVGEAMLASLNAEVEFELGLTPTLAPMYVFEVEVGEQHPVSKEVIARILYPSNFGTCWNLIQNTSTYELYRCNGTTGGCAVTDTCIEHDQQYAIVPLASPGCGDASTIQIYKSGGSIWKIRYDLYY
jgi:hypothetical protein